MDLQELLGKIADMSDDELRAETETLRARFEELSEDLTDENLAEMDRVAGAITAVSEQLNTREEVVSSRQNKAAELRAKIDAVKPESVEAEEVEAPAAEATPEVQAPVTGENEPEVVETREPALVTAAAQPSIAELSSRRPTEMAPVARQKNGRMAVTAAADVPGFSAGQAFPEFEDVGRGFVEKARALAGTSGIRGARYPVARFALDYPEGLVLNPQDPHGNGEKILEALSERNAIVASGGLCAPLEAHYGLENISAASRPVRDSLPQFNAKRGGIRFVEPPHLTDVTGAIDYITADDDAAGGASATKALLTVSCGDIVEVEIAAVTLRLQVGQFSLMTYPEQFRTWYDLALAMHARVAEGRLLAGFSANSTAVTDGQNLGAARDLLESYARLATQYRNRHRMAPESVLEGYLPHWVADMIIADLTRQLPGDDVWKTNRSDVEAMFRDRGVNIHWYLDERAGSGQIFGAQGAGTGNPWITTVEGYLFHPGAFLFLDGGTLDLGVEIRDSALIATNDVQAFMETFENVAFTGIESLRVRNTVCVSGGSSGTVSFTCPGAGS